MINTTGITSLYTSLTDAIASKLDALYTTDKIDAETYAKIMAQSFDDALKLSVSAVQQQEQIEKDGALKDAQIAQTAQQTSNMLLEAGNITKQGLLLVAQTNVQGQQQLNLASEKLRTDAQTSQITAETLNVPKQGLLIDAQKEVQLQQKLNLVSEELRIEAQTAQVAAETANATKQGALIDAQKDVQVQQKFTLASEELRVDAQTAQIKAETLNAPKQGRLIDAQKEVATQQAANLTSEGLNISKIGSKIDADAALVTQQKLNLVSEELGIDARTALTTQQKDNAAVENTVLVAQECKLRAEYDGVLANTLRVASEKSLLDQKKITEQAQTTAGSAAEASVLGRQMALYQAQATGYQRDAEQKAAEIMFKSWATRKTTDDTTPVNDSNKLTDAYIGTAISKLLAGIGG